MNQLPLAINRLEQYTLRHPGEVLLLLVEREEGEDCILVFKGFSSSLVSPTYFDPEIPLVSAEDRILKVDRLASPYQPDRPEYLEQNIAWEEMARRLNDLGL